MANTSCPKCGVTSFEVATISPRGTKFKKSVVQCASCGSPIAAGDFVNLGSQMESVFDRLDRIEKMLNRLLGGS
jgi:predicted RNA-binding Zn-ribbon protein involved in translation (DUF1610 family)